MPLSPFANGHTKTLWKAKNTYTSTNNILTSGGRYLQGISRVGALLRKTASLFVRGDDDVARAAPLGDPLVRRVRAMRQVGDGLGQVATGLVHVFNVAGPTRLAEGSVFFLVRQGRDGGGQVAVALHLVGATGFLESSSFRPGRLLPRQVSVVFFIMRHGGCV